MCVYTYMYVTDCIYIEYRFNYLIFALHTIVWFSHIFGYVRVYIFLVSFVDFLFVHYVTLRYERIYMYDVILICNTYVWMCIYIYIAELCRYIYIYIYVHVYVYIITYKYIYTYVWFLFYFIHHVNLYLYSRLYIFIYTYEFQFSLFHLSVIKLKCIYLNSWVLHMHIYVLHFTLYSTF